ncbi:hypothetical protein ACFE04_010215 [Oxalis oulophora]
MASILLTIGEPILSDVISRLFDKATTSDFIHFLRKENLEVEIKNWHKNLTNINAVLADAEKKKTTSEASNSVKEWLTDLRALVYDVEDVFDELNYVALRRKFTIESQVARCSSKMRALIPSCCSTFSLSNVKFGAKLKDITTRFDQIVKKEKNLGLTKNSYVKLEKRKPTSSFVDKSRYLTSEPCPSENIALLQEKLKEKLSLKKFLIVIDDVCNGNFDDWETLCLPFKTGVAGCKILVTTRNKFVMTTMNVTPHHLDQLSIEDCVLILQYYALGEMDNGEAYNEINNVRHSSFVSSRYDIFKRFKNISELKHLRTFLTLHKGNEGEYLGTHFLSYDVLHRMLPKLKFLRVLSLYGYAITLIWSNEFYDSRDEVLQMKVLDSLEPNKNLKVLQIESYCRNDFSSWLGNPCFASMERITLLGCKKSKWLPSLGRLPLLKYLRIEGNDGVESVGREFSSSKSFLKLETLEFENMLNWVDAGVILKASKGHCGFITYAEEVEFAGLKYVQAGRSSPRHAIILKTSLKDAVKKSFNFQVQLC